MSIVHLSLCQFRPSKKQTSRQDKMGKTHAEREKKVGKREGGREKGEAGRQEGDIHSICHLWDSQACAQRRMLSHLIETDYRPQAE